LGNNGKYLNIDSVELIETSPSTSSCKSFEELGNHEMVHTIRAVEHDTLSSKRLRQILDSLSLASSSWSLRSSSIVEEDSTAESSVASVGKRGNNQSARVSKILVVVVHDGVDDLYDNGVVLPVVSEL